MSATGTVRNPVFQQKHFRQSDLPGCVRRDLFARDEAIVQPAIVGKDPFVPLTGIGR